MKCGAVSKKQQRACGVAGLPNFGFFRSGFPGERKRALGTRAHPRTHLKNVVTAPTSCPSQSRIERGFGSFRSIFGGTDCNFVAGHHKVSEVLPVHYRVYD